MADCGHCCSCGFDSRHLRERYTVRWHRDHKRHHLSRFPDSDLQTRNNLQMFVDMARARR